MTPAPSPAAGVAPDPKELLRSAQKSPSPPGVPATKVHPAAERDGGDIAPQVITDLPSPARGALLEV